MAAIPNDERKAYYGLLNALITGFYVVLHAVYVSRNIPSFRCSRPREEFIIDAARRLGSRGSLFSRLRSAGTFLQCLDIVITYPWRNFSSMHPGLLHERDK